MTAIELLKLAENKYDKACIYGNRSMRQKAFRRVILARKIYSNWTDYNIAKSIGLMVYASSAYGRVKRDIEKYKQEI